jgi:CDP-glucose 4,6-dehydratase
MVERASALENVVTPAFWKDRRVFITGHTGFKGAWLVALLNHVGARVTGYALDPPTQPSLYQWAYLDEWVVDQREDVRNLPRLRAVLQHAQPEILIHLAAQSLVRASFLDPVGTYETNVGGTTNVLEAVYRQQAHIAPRVALIVTTDKVYRHNGSDHPFREDAPLGGQADPYSTSKACAEMICTQYAEMIGDRCAVLSARAGNVIGGGDFAQDRILPDAVRAFSRGQRLSVRYPQAIRPWQHVLDPLCGYLALCERSFEKSAEFSGAWNFGPQAAHEWSVEELVDAFAKNWSGAGWQWQAALNPPETDVLRLDSSKAREFLDWQCRMPLRDALQRAAHFYQAMARGADVRALMHSEIEDYFSLCASS